jgi:hypothetical protein
MYGKYMSVSKKYHAHAEAAYNEGDLVEIQEGRPISKTKAWTVTKLRAGCFGLIKIWLELVWKGWLRLGAG